MQSFHMSYITLQIVAPDTITKITRYEVNGMGRTISLEELKAVLRTPPITVQKVLHHDGQRASWDTEEISVMMRHLRTAMRKGSECLP